MPSRPLWKLDAILKAVSPQSSPCQKKKEKKNNKKAMAALCRLQILMSRKHDLLELHLVWTPHTAVNGSTSKQRETPRPQKSTFTFLSPWYQIPSHWYACGATVKYVTSTTHHFVPLHLRAWTSRPLLGRHAFVFGPLFIASLFEPESFLTFFFFFSLHFHFFF